MKLVWWNKYMDMCVRSPLTCREGGSGPSPRVSLSFGRRKDRVCEGSASRRGQQYGLHRPFYNGELRKGLVTNCDNKYMQLPQDQPSVLSPVPYSCLVRIRSVTAQSWNLEDSTAPLSDVEHWPFAIS